jgi:hypothetical protein
MTPKPILVFVLRSILVGGIVGGLGRLLVPRTARFGLLPTIPSAPWPPSAATSWAGDALVVGAPVAQVVTRARRPALPQAVGRR